MKVKYILDSVNDPHRNTRGSVIINYFGEIVIYIGDKIFTSFHDNYVKNHRFDRRRTRKGIQQYVKLNFKKDAYTEKCFYLKMGHLIATYIKFSLNGVYLIESK